MLSKRHHWPCHNVCVQKLRYHAARTNIPVQRHTHVSIPVDIRHTLIFHNDLWHEQPGLLPQAEFAVDRSIDGVRRKRLSCKNPSAKRLINHTGSLFGLSPLFSLELEADIRQVLIINPKPELFPWVVAIDVILHAAIAVIIKIKTPDPVLAVLAGVGIALHQPLNIVLYQGKLLL